MFRVFVRTFFYSSRAMKSKSGLPDRWDKYCPMGKVIPGTNFIAFKVPLKEEMLRRVEEKDKFSPSILVQKLETEGLKLGVIIDLTFTLRYYNKDDFIKQSINHEKIFTQGHEVPSDGVFRQFAYTVKRHSKEDQLVGVHCTHGVNRTGYLICRYMIEELNVEPATAISLFNEARGHNLERENYLRDLRNRRRGESTCGDLSDIQRNQHEESGSSNGKYRKPRWRHNKEDHPGWRQKQGDTGDSRRGQEPHFTSQERGDVGYVNHRATGASHHRGDERSWRQRSQQDPHNRESGHHGRVPTYHRSDDRDWRRPSARGFSHPVAGHTNDWHGWQGQSLDHSHQRREQYRSPLDRVHDEADTYNSYNQPHSSHHGWSGNQSRRDGARGRSWQNHGGARQRDHRGNRGRGGNHSQDDR